MKKLALVLGAVLLLTPAPLRSQVWSAPQMEVWKTVETMWELSAKGDIEGEMAYCDDALTIWLQGAPLPSDKSSFRKWATFGSKNEQTPVQELKPITIAVFPECAIVHYYVTSVTVSVPTGKAEMGSLKITDVFRKKGDRWFWIGGHNSVVP